jgi:predicted regulator of Ras-like GTPase activity (Roadblock/LC7/MglB family)
LVHWFESKVDQLWALAKDYRELNAGPRSPAAEAEGSAPHTRRSELLAEARTLVEDVAHQPGVSACLICVDGLVLAQAGEAPDFEALAAYTQTSLRTASHGADALQLGDIRQIVVVGEAQKVAIVAIEELALCILSPQSTVLLSALKHKAKA